MEAPARAWLDLLCRTIPGVSRGVLLLGQPGAPESKPVATWPSEAPPSAELVAAARTAREHDRAVVNGRPGAGPAAKEEPASEACHVAVPLPGAAGAVAVEVAVSSAFEASALADELRVGAAWLHALQRGERSSARLRQVLRLIGVCLDQESFSAAATAAATAIATQLGCERVSVGLLRAGRMRVEAISHSAHFDEKTHLVRDLAAAMEEAADQDAALVYPTPKNAPPRIVHAHHQLAEAHTSANLCSVPLTWDGAAVGALLLERPAGAGFSSDTVRFCEDVASTLAPALVLKRRAESGLLERGRERLRSDYAKLVRPGNTRAKTVVAGVLAALVLLGFAKAEYRVKADATLEGRVQRAVVAPVEGFIAEAHARAGDVVRKGQTLGRLDDRDLQVEGDKWRARREQLRVEYFEAMAAHDRTQVNIVNAKVAQAEAQIALVEEQFARTRLLAPFDGVVVKGDLSQSLGSPAERGDVLFEVAPLDGYRIILKVDERDVSDVEEGRRGKLTLSAMPGESLPFTVERVTPVATAEDGRNYFRAEARLDHPPGSLRPGMQGVAKIDIEGRRLAWIWTHDAVDWLRLRLWSWWP